MKKIFKLLTLALMATFALASCEDVPEPYPNPNPNENGGGEEQVIEPVGDGSLDTPYNVKALVDFINEGEYAGKEVYFKGIITSFKSGEEPGNSYGNSTFYISDNGSATNTFYVYRCYGLNGEKFSKEGQIVVGDTVVIKSTVTVYNGTLETEQNKGQIVSVNGKKAYHDGSETPDQPAGEAKGDGTLANPYNVAGVNAYLDGAYDDTKEVYFTGIISKFKSGEEPGNSYGNSTFYISEDGQTGGEDFYCYRIFGLNGEKFTSADQLKVGDLVVVKSPVTVYTSSYGSTKETVQNKGQLVSVNGKEAYSNGQTSTGGNTDQPDQPATGTEVTCAQAAELAMALEDKAESAETYTVTGYITETDGKISRDQQVFWMADAKDGGKVFEAYWANIPDPTQALPVGTKVKMTGKLKRYGSTPEMQNGQVVVLEMGEGGSTQPDNGGDTPSGDASEYSTTVTYSLGANAYDDGVASVNGVEGVKVLKIGTSKNPGDLTVTVPASGKLTFYAVTWKGAGSATVKFLDANEEVATQSVKANEGAANNSPYTMTVGDSDKYEVTLPAGKQIKITSDKRVIFFGMK